MILRGVVAAEPVEPLHGEVASAEQRVGRLAGAELFAQRIVFDIALEDPPRHIEPQRGVPVVYAVPAPAVYDVLGEKLHHVDARRAAEVAAAPEPRIDLKKKIASGAAVILHINVGKADIAQLLQKRLQLPVQRRVAARENGGVVADRLGVIVLQHRLTETHRTHPAVKVGIAVEHAHGVVAAGNKLLQDELAAVVGSVHRLDHREILFAGAEEKYFLLSLKVTAQIIERVAVFGLDDDGKIKGHALNGGGAVVPAADKRLGIVKTVFLAQRIEAVLGVKGLEQRFGNKTVGDQAFKVIVVAAQKTCIIVRAGDDEQLAVLLRALTKNAQKHIGEYILALKVRNDAAEEQVRMPRGDELLRAKQQRRDLGICLAEQARGAVGVFIAAQNDGQEVMLAAFLHFPASLSS